MAVVHKFLVRDSDGRIETFHNMNAPWVNPGGGNWDNVGTTHSEAELGVDLIHTGSGIYPTPLMNDLGGYEWKKVGTAFTARSQADKDPEELEESKKRRSMESCRLKRERAAAQAVIDDVGSPADMVTKATADRDAMDTKITSHQTNYETVWTPGTNP